MSGSHHASTSTRLTRVCCPAATVAISSLLHPVHMRDDHHRWSTDIKTTQRSPHTIAPSNAIPASGSPSRFLGDIVVGPQSADAAVGGAYSLSGTERRADQCHGSTGAHPRQRTGDDGCCGM